MFKIKYLLGIVSVGFLLCGHALGQEQQPAKPDFEAFMAGVKSEAVGRGFSAETIALLDHVEPIAKAVESDHRQPEFSVRFSTYLKAIMKPVRIAKGRKLMQSNQALLKAVAQKYHVQPRFIVALWAIESGYGQSMGGYSVLSSLSTMAWEGRRAQFFRDELFHALTIIDHGDVPASQMVGSWAGAMGQCQFMPSTFLKYAQDWEGDGKRDIWHDRGDVLASTANYLSQIGWKDDRGWGRPVKLPKGFDRHLIGLETHKTMKEWAKLGVLTDHGKALPGRSWDTSIVLADPDEDQAFLVTDNFRALMIWNRSTLFALSVGHLADALGHR